MESYRTIRGEVVDLTTLAPQEAAFLGRAIDLYRSSPDSREFTRFIYDSGNPLLQPPKRFPDSVMWHPMIKALLDLEYRLGLAQGLIRADPADEVTSDPFAVG